MCQKTKLQTSTLQNKIVSHLKLEELPKCLTSLQLCSGTFKKFLSL